LSAQEVRTHSALHVLKGAVVNVMGPHKTSSGLVSGRRGTLVVNSDRSPTPEEVWAIEEAANKKISENSEVLQFEMERNEAEGHFGAAINDEAPDPQVTLLTILRMPDWEVACCAEKHVDTTGELVRLKLDRVSFTRATGLLEIEFEIDG
jgi:alanyl-tRNA synthetase